MKTETINHPDNEGMTYKGVYISVLFPSGFYQYYSDKQRRFLTFDCLSDCKRSIKNKE